MRDCILLCSCGESELLPQTPDLPADTFTACLTTPIKVLRKISMLGRRLGVEERDLRELS